MNYRNMAKSIPILIKYTPDKDMGSLQAEHDIIYSDLSNSAEISADDELELIDLGWFKSDADVWAAYT